MPSISTPAIPRKVIYIAGYGRSGSTLLDIALGMHSSIFGGGELTALARHAWQNHEFCACGETVRKCPLWSSVIAAWNGNESSVDERFRHLARAQQWLETLVSPARLLSIRPYASIFKDATGKLFDGLAQATGNPDLAIVDSSKLPGRGLMLAETPGLELYVIHLVRDARAVAWSLSKSYAVEKRSGVQRELKPKSSAYVALRWSSVNLAAERLCAAVGAARSMRLRYEDFVGDPARALSLVAQMCGLADTSGRQATGLLTPAHQVAGSRHRMLPEMAVRVEDEWSNAMPEGQRRLVTALTFPLLKRYGYMSGPRQQQRWDLSKMANV